MMRKDVHDQRGMLLFVERLRITRILFGYRQMDNMYQMDILIPMEFMTL